MTILKQDYSWKKSHNFIRRNFEAVKKRFPNLGHKFLKNGTFFTGNIMTFLKKNSTRVELCTKEKKFHNCSYMLLRSVIHEGKRTTKIRIIYDASSKQIYILSLN